MVVRFEDLMEFNVYSHQKSSMSGEHMAFYATLERCRFGAAVFRDLYLRLDPMGEFEGPLEIYQIAIQVPDRLTMIELLNAPDLIWQFCVIRKDLLETTSN